MREIRSAASLPQRNLPSLASVAALALLPVLAACGAGAPDDGASTESTGNALSIGRLPGPPPPVIGCTLYPIGCMPTGTRLLVVGPSTFATDMDRLVSHKNATGMPATWVTMDQVRNYSGGDDAAKLKNVISLAHAKGVSYVLLAGDATVVPVRRRMVFDLAKNAFGFIPADLYYANLTHHAGPHAGAPDSWDDDQDGLYDLEYWANTAYSQNPDGVDGYPDVAVGRVPAASPAEFARFVDKDIHYETILNPAMNLSRAAFIADANYPGADSLINSMIAGSFLGGLGAGSRWGANYSATNPPPVGFTSASNFVTVDGLFAGQSWVGFVGHGNPSVWDIVDNGAFFDAGHVAGLANPTPPIVVAAACETAQFSPVLTAWPNTIYDASPTTSIGGTFLTGSPAEGGAIAYFGEMVVLPNWMGVELETDMLNGYGVGHRTLGDVWLHGARTYWQKHLTDEDVFANPRIYLAIMAMLGDPSLRLA